MVACSSGPQTNNSSVDQRVEDLLAKMTLEEKLGQLNQVSAMDNLEDMAAQIRMGRVGSILNGVGAARINVLQRVAVEETRLGIPILMSRDVIHGYKTIAPIPLGQAASFDLDAVQEAARIAAIEATTDGVRWTFSPMIDIARDARWGRIAEGYGEDTYLTTQMGVATIKGYQGDDLSDPTSIAACAKHFCGYGASEGGRDYNSANIPPRQLLDVYLPPFKAAAKAGAATFMTSFNEIDGVPSTANAYILKTQLRDEWHSDAMVVTDWASSAEMLAHGNCSDRADVAAQSINAGVDMEMVAETFIQNLPDLIKDGRVKMSTVDNAVRNVLRLKFRLGLFDNPYVDENKNVAYSPEFIEKTLKLTTESAILLKNDNKTLPFSSKVKTIALVGPMADAAYEQSGTWTFDGEAEHTITPLKALQSLEGVKVLYEPALTHCRDQKAAGIASAVAKAKQADVVVCVVGEEAIMSGEAHSLADINLYGKQKDLIEALSKTGKPLVTVIMAGRPLTIAKQIEESNALLYMFHPGTTGGTALADLLFGKAVPSGKTPVTFPYMVGQLPIYYNHKNTGRPAAGTELLIDQTPVGAGQTSLGCSSYWLDAGYGPLFPFGYGLSYTTFEYSNVKLSATELKVNDTLKVTFDLANTGEYDATEICQLYVRDLVGSVTRPVKELKGFKRVALKAGEKKQVEFELPISELAFTTLDMQNRVEPGDFKLWVAANSDDNSNEASFTVK
ncbi:MAG: glycoside hydrolase family 3 C-terminal domain-containing protein [Bacteroidales bacterium]|nr:glycoside hydrolase family 3 C-terminal domain-containing protein [Bacteroidales bacterium]